MAQHRVRIIPTENAASIASNVVFPLSASSSECRIGIRSAVDSVAVILKVVVAVQAWRGRSQIHPGVGIIVNTAILNNRRRIVEIDAVCTIGYRRVHHTHANAIFVYAAVGVEHPTKRKCPT